MFNEELHKKLVKLYTIPGVDEVVFRKNNGMPKVKCWKCHHRPCICE